MLNYMDFLNTPTEIATVLVALFLVIQVIGELLEFKGKVVPEFIKVRKYFARKKKERGIIAQMPDTLAKVEELLDDVKKHYDDDNITKRNNWMKWVDEKADVYDNALDKYDTALGNLEKKIDNMMIESKRSSIINFASKVIDENFPVTREQFNRIFKMYNEYEQIIEENGLTNGEVDIAIRIIKEAYEAHMKTHTFVEDLRGYM